MSLALPTLVGLKTFFKSKKVLIALAIVALLAAIAYGTYSYINTAKNDAVEAAVSKVNDKATIDTYKTETIIRDRTVKIDIDMDKLREQTIKDYNDARNQINNATLEAREERAPDLVIDTLNNLSRMHEARDAGGIPDAEVPVG